MCDARSRPCPRRPRTAAGRTSRSRPRPRSRPRRAARASVGLEPPERHRRLALARRAPRASASALEIPVGALAIPGSRSIQRPCVSSMSSVRARRRRRRAGRPARAARARRQRLEPLVVDAQVEKGPERAGDERDALATGGSRRSPRRRSSSARRRPRGRALRRPRASRGEESTPITCDAGHRRSGSRSARCRHRARRPARPGERLVDVERDVLDDARAPRVVEARDRVVGAQAGLRATQTNSSDSSVNGRARSRRTAPRSRGRRRRSGLPTRTSSSHQSEDAERLVAGIATSSTRLSDGT